MTPFGTRLLTLVLVGSVLVGVPPGHAQDDSAIRIARVKYQGGGDWYSDRKSLVELLAFVREQTLMDVGTEEEVVALTSDKVFSYPYLYLTGHGNVTFSAAEADRLRRYLLQGGFLHVDDNYGLDEYIREELAKVFPEKELVELPFDHPIYHTRYDIPDGPPKVHKHDGERPQGYAILDDGGRVMVYYTHEADLGDGWDPASVHDNPPEKRRAAFRMGVNILAYAMTH
ncbi:MAG: hypothetical protein BRD55_06825 [Bacteroidetes bacterium SW_9_63_38]|nr:MAG: hypothetical protein BRD55_06825 [Bacteroidetes bacterium SW_9_63_38]